MRVVATTDFGKNLLFDQTIELRHGSTAMDGLRQIAEVQTAYGGGFVSSINGITSGGKTDWFFYMNGVCANVGARDYVLHAGDVVHWDYHDWSYQQFIPAIVGDFPHPFLNGYAGKVAPTLVVYEDAFALEAEALAQRLRDCGVSQVSTTPSAQLPGEAKKRCNLLIIGSLRNDLISELNNLHRKLGFYTDIEDPELHVHDASGNIAAEYDREWGLLQATQNPWNPNGTGACENVAFMVTGSDVDSVKRAASVLANTTEALHYAFAVIIADGKVIKVP